MQSGRLDGEEAMSELHLPSEAMDQIDRQFWQSIEHERSAFLRDGPGKDGTAWYRADPGPEPSTPQSA